MTPNTPNSEVLTAERVLGVVPGVLGTPSPPGLTTTIPPALALSDLSSMLWFFTEYAPAPGVADWFLEVLTNAPLEMTPALLDQRGFWEKYDIGGRWVECLVRTVGGDCGGKVEKGESGVGEVFGGDWEEGTLFVEDGG